MRKSVSQTYFLTIATVILFGLFSMGILQIGMSIHYFTNERRQALSTALDIMEVQAQYFADSGPDHQAAVQSDALGQQLELINSTTQNMLMIANSDGLIVRSAGYDEHMNDAHLTQAVMQRLDGGEDVYGRDDLGGLLDQKYYILARRMNVGDSHFYLLACMRSSTINEYVGDMFSSFILSAGLTLLLSSVLSIVLTNRITQPLHDIGEAARRFGGGDFSARVAPSGDDEITSLAQTFNSMAVNLESIDKSRSQFMGNLAHELRTPMTSVKGFVDGMLDGTIPPEMQHHYLEIVSQETGRLARLVQNMLDITKLEAGEYKVHARSYDVWETLTGVLLANEQRVLAGKIVINDLAPVPTMVYADPDLVHQVVQNLMDNALKFTPPGGNIRFEVKRLQPGIVEVSITNTGEGISPEALPFVFQRFYKEDASRGLNAKGSGLGLHICKVLITLSGGTIRVDSKQGEWCRFTFTLPEPPAPPRQRRGGKKES